MSDFLKNFDFTSYTLDILLIVDFVFFQNFDCNLHSDLLYIYENSYFLTS